MLFRSAQIDEDVSRVGIVDFDGTIIRESTCICDAHNMSWDEFTDKVCDEIEKVIAEADFDKSRIIGLGIGVPGLVDTAHGIVLSSPQLRWENIQLAKYVESRLGYKTTIDNVIKAKALAENPITGKALADYGTAILVNIVNEAGGLPTRNFERGRFPKHENVSGEKMNELTAKRGGEGKVAHGCMSGCVIRCSGLYPGKDGKLIGKWPEYETIWGFGPHSEIDDLDLIAHFDYLCDDYGVDTIDVSVAIGVAMAGGGIPWGDGKAVLEAMHGISEGTPLGRVIGCGTATTGRVFGVRRVPCVKGQSLPAYDPRAVKGQGVTYATTPMGADHTAGYAVTANILSVGGHVDPLKKEGQVELSRNLQIATASIDSVGLCLFTAFALLDVPDALPAVVDMLNAKFGWSLTGDDVTSLGKRVLTTEVDFNRRAGIGEALDRLPDFFMDEKLPPHETTFDFTDKELQETLNFVK